MKNVLGHTLITATAVTAAAWIPTAATAATTANRDSSCPATVAAPNVKITHSFTKVYATLTKTCEATYASWNIKNSGGIFDTLIYDPAKPNQNDSLIFPGVTKLGRHDVVPVTANNGTTKRVAQKISTFYVKIGSGTLLFVTRENGHLTISGRVQKYHPNTTKWVPWNGATVVIQGRPSATLPWLPIDVPQKTSKKGQFTHTVLLSNLRQYRLATQDTSTTWGSTSATFTQL